MGGEAKASRVHSYGHHRKMNPGKKIHLHFSLQGKVCSPSLPTGKGKAGEWWKPRRVGHLGRLGLPQSHSSSRARSQARAAAVMNEGGSSAAKDNFVSRYY